MMAWMSGGAVFGIVLLLLASLGSDIGVDFGAEGGSSFATGAIGAFLGIGGGAGMITIGLGLPPVLVIMIAGVAGFISSAIIVRIMGWMLDNSSDDDEYSIENAVGTITGIVLIDTKPGEIGSMMMDMGSGPQRLFFTSSVALAHGDEVIVSSYDDARNMVTVMPAHDADIIALGADVLAGIAASITDDATDSDEELMSDDDTGDNAASNGDSSVDENVDSSVDENVDTGEVSGGTGVSVLPVGLE